MQQLTINLEQSLTQQFPNWMDVVRASVYGCGKPFKSIAADLDMSASELSRRLSPDGDIPALMEHLPKLIETTGDHRPIYWLVERFMENDATKQKRVVDRLSKILPEVHNLLAQIQKGTP